MLVLQEKVVLLYCVLMTLRVEKISNKYTMQLAYRSGMEVVAEFAVKEYNVGKMTSRT